MFTENATAGLTTAPTTNPLWWSCNSKQSPSAVELLDLIITAGPDKIATMFVPVALVIIMIALFIDEVIFLVKNSLHWRRTVYTVWVLAVYPILGGLCLIGLFMPRTISITSFARSFYFAIALKKFFNLVLQYYGGRRKMEEALREVDIVSANPFPCCFVCCCYNTPMTVRRINQLQLVVYQVILVFPLIYFIQTVMVSEGILGESRVAGLIYTVLGLVTTCSGFVCLYGFIILNKSSRVTLQQFHIRPKFICVQLVVAANTIQKFTINVVNRFAGLPCGLPYPDRQQSTLLHTYIFIYELFIISVISWFIFKHNEEGCEVVKIRSQPPQFSQISDDSTVIQISSITDKPSYENGTTEVSEPFEEKKDVIPSSHLYYIDGAETETV